jgi:hypothetical protein
MTKKQRDEIIQELNNFELMAENDTPAEEATSAPKIEICARVRKGARKLRHTAEALRHKIVGRRKNIIKLLNNLISATTDTVPPIVDMPVDVPVDVPVNVPVNVPVKIKPIVEMKKVVEVEENAVETVVESKPAVLVRLAGVVSEVRCARCEELDDEEVCGDNGKTYRTLCHAVNCGGLALKDISVGSCVTKVHIVCS